MYAKHKVSIPHKSKVMAKVKIDNTQTGTNLIIVPDTLANQHLLYISLHGYTHLVPDTSLVKSLDPTSVTSLSLELLSSSDNEIAEKSYTFLLKLAVLK